MTLRASPYCCCPGGTAVDWPISTLLEALHRKKNRDSLVVQDVTKNAREALQRLNNDTRVFVSLRNGTDQTKTGLISGATASSREMNELQFDPESHEQNSTFNQEKTSIFLCLGRALSLRRNNRD